ncbi:MAG: hypothetical protein ACK52I_17660, partial [Pseudomonadota bacterium]
MTPPTLVPPAAGSVFVPPCRDTKTGSLPGAATASSRNAVVDALEGPSVAVAATVRTNSPLPPAGTATASPAICAAVRAQTPPPRLVPLFRVAPPGTPEICSARLSEPSRSVRAEEMDSGIELPAFPLAAVTPRLGVSATASTVTRSVALVAAVLPPGVSVAVAVTVRTKSASAFDG